jgi:NTP pyrophosphatase (non-canonical NTP hydrolase)
MSFRAEQQSVDGWISQFEEGYFAPLVNVARLAEEVGELAREVNHRFGPKRKKPDEPAGGASIAMELADILFVVICIANSQGIDLDEAFKQMMAKVTSRDAGRWTRKAR